MGARFRFTDVWTILHPIETVWPMIDDVSGWPSWWPDYRRVEKLTPDRHGVGERWRAWVRANLP